MGDENSETNTDGLNTNTDGLNTNTDGLHTNTELPKTSKQLTPSDPYFVHPSENPTSVLVQPLLDGDNYSIWLRSMSKALSAKAKFGFVSGEFSEPDIADKEQHNHWKRADDLVSSWICSSTIPQIKSTIDYLSSSLLVWNDLKERFAQTSSPKLFQLKQTIASVKQTDQPLSAHYTRMRTLWDEIDSIRPLPNCICGASKQTLEIMDQDRAMEFLQCIQFIFLCDGFLHYFLCGLICKNTPGRIVIDDLDGELGS